MNCYCTEIGYTLNFNKKMIRSINLDIREIKLIDFKKVIMSTSVIWCLFGLRSKLSVRKYTNLNMCILIV